MDVVRTGGDLPDNWSWTIQPDQAVISARKLGDQCSFQIQDPTGKVHELAMNQVKGWKRLLAIKDQSLLSRTSPLLNKERTGIIFTIFSTSLINADKEGVALAYLDESGRLAWNLLINGSFHEVAFENIQGLEPSGKVHKLFLKRREFPYRVELLQEAPFMLRFSSIGKLQNRDSDPATLSLPNSVTIAALKQQFQSKFQASIEKPLLYLDRPEGKAPYLLKEDKTLAYYGINETDALIFCNELPKVFFNLPVRIISSDGTVTDDSICISKRTTIGELKKIIQKKASDWHGHVVIEIQGKSIELEDDRTLEHYDIDEEDILGFRLKHSLDDDHYVMEPDRARAALEAASMQAMLEPAYAMAAMPFRLPFRRRDSWYGGQEIESSDLHALHNVGQIWQKVSPGLNLVGICENQPCAAFGKRIFLRYGFGTFNMNKLASTSKCPSCVTTAKKIDNCGFWKCVYSIDGAYKDSDKKKVTVNEENLIAPDDKFLLFEPAELKEFLFMDITVREKIKEDRAKEKKLSKNNCNLM